MTANQIETCNRIAQKVLGLETLEFRGRDGLDFHELGVGQIQDALKAAYQAGQAATIQSLRALERTIVAAQLSLLDDCPARRNLHRAHCQTLRLIARAAGKTPQGKLPAA